VVVVAIASLPSCGAVVIYDAVGGVNTVLTLTTKKGAMATQQRTDTVYCATLLQSIRHDCVGAEVSYLLA